MKTIEVALSKKAIASFASCYELAVPMLAKLRLCFDVDVLKDALFQLEKSRLSVTGSLSELTGDDCRVGISCCFLCRSLEHYIAGLLLLKQDKGSRAWTHMIDALEHLDHVKVTFVPTEAMAEIEMYAARIENLLQNCFPEPTYQSVSYEIGKDECSICSRPMLDCDHIPGKYYGTQLCQRKIHDLQIRECSIVEVPRDRGCVATEFTDNGTVYEVYSGRRSFASGKDGLHMCGIIARVQEAKNPLDWAPILEEAQ